ncbi:putative T7SS-secreted protein [Streptomyces sp. NPDC003077]|uniref:putative T7SS-secreted protein n=1 Tax=Streptomyces sp. NPDC003077 TaxID=3154443 RepID=UPI0033B2F8AE
MSSDQFPNIGFNPAPGKLESVSNLTRQLTKATSSIESAHSTLRRIGGGGKTWEGEAANAFTEKVGDLPKYLEDSLDALRSASKQLDAWHGKLTTHQSKAREYEADAKAAKARLDSAEAARDRATSTYNQAASHPDLKLAGQTFTTQSQLQSAQARLDSASNRLQEAGNKLDEAGKHLNDARDELDGIIKQAEKLLAKHQADARTIAQQLRKANDRAPDPGFWEGMSDAFTRLGHKIQNWCTKHADKLKKLGDILSAISGVLAVASLLTMWCPPLSGAFALAGGVTALGALGAHGAAKIGGADVSWKDIGLDAFSALPGGKFLAIGATGKVGKAFNAVKSDAAITGGLKFVLTGQRPVQGATNAAKKLSEINKLKFAEAPLSKLADKLNNVPMDPKAWWYRGSWLGISGGGTALKVPGLLNSDPPAAGAKL